MIAQRKRHCENCGAVILHSVFSDDWGKKSYCGNGCGLIIDLMHGDQLKSKPATICSLNLAPNGVITPDNVQPPVQQQTQKESNEV